MDEGAPAAAPARAVVRDDEMAEEVRVVRQMVADLHDREGGAPAPDEALTVGALSDSDRDKVQQVCSATGAEPEVAELWVRRTKGDVNLAIAEVYAYR